MTNINLAKRLSNNMFLDLAYFVFLSLISTEVGGRRWHTSQTGLKQLYDLQKEHFDAINVYLDLETRQLEELKNNLDAVREWNDHIKSKTNTYLHIHINAVRTMSWFHERLFKINKLVNNRQSIKALNRIDKNKDLSGDHIFYAYQALRRLQRFYGLRASDVVAGKYLDRVIGDPLNACECFVMTEYCFNDHDMYGVIDWAVEVYNKWKNNSRLKCVDMDRLNEYIVLSSMYTGFDYRHFFDSNGIYYQKDNTLYARDLLLMRNELINMHESRTLKVLSVYHEVKNDDEIFTFKKLCENGASLRILTKDSKCRYQTKNSYYRLLMPFKEEDVSNDPFIKLYHDVLYDEEILKIKSMAANTLYDAEIVSQSGGDKLKEHSRSGQVSWLPDSSDKKLFNSLNSRIECLTEFSIKFSEPYQIVNYGLGGHYVPHLDSFTHYQTRKLFKDYGNRIATVLFYMTDVENDGYTVYPSLNIVSSAIKGTALIWLNLNIADGSINVNSNHGSCPLLKGNKWIMTKWLHERGQNLNYDWKSLLEV